MSKKALNVTVAVLSAVVMVAAAAGLYSVESTRVSVVAENQSYIYCAERVLSRADSLGLADAPYSWESTPAEGSGMAAQLQWLADYNTDLSRLERDAKELSSSDSVENMLSGSSYADVCRTAVSYHQMVIDETDGKADVLTGVCVAAFVLGLGGEVFIAVRKSEG